MSARKVLHFVLVWAVIASLCLPAAASASSASSVETETATRAGQFEPAKQPDSGLFRTSITVDNPTGWDRLAGLGVVILERSNDSGLVLVDDDQLQTLARLRLQPQTSDELGELLRVQGPEKAWLSISLQKLVEKGAVLQAQIVGKAEASTIDTARLELHAAMADLTAEQRAGLAALSSLDDDGDGLTNTEEAWWCTDPMNPNSDGDAQGYSDGHEVDALLDPTLPRDIRKIYRTPFLAWPPFVAQIAPGSEPTCLLDSDHDSIPDLAEINVIGLRVPGESSDYDKYDDGQEFFGITYCPGGSASCSYGNYPRTQDYSFITNEMPSWIRPPGDSPFVAAYPVIDFLVDPTTIRVVAKEIRTVERTITQGEEISTGFAETIGNSTTVGTIDTNTHSTWQENSTTEGGIEPALVTETRSRIGSTEVVAVPSLHDSPLVQMPGSVSCSGQTNTVLSSPVNHNGVDYPVLVSDSLFLFSPTVHSFDVRDFIEANSGPLRSYQEQLDGSVWTAPEIIRYIAMFYGVNPQVILVLLEAHNSLLTNVNAQIPQEERLGVLGVEKPTFYGYVDSITRTALEAYEQARYDQFIGELKSATGETISVSTNLNSGTIAVQAALAGLLSLAEWSQWVTQRSALFVSTFEGWFGNPLAEPDATCTSNTLPEGYILPFPIGTTWYYTGGPHHYTGSGSRPWSSIDVAQAQSIRCPGGAYPKDEWVTAAQKGNVVESSQALVVIDHGDGWKTYYSHIASQDRVGTGSIDRSSHLGHPSCEVESGGRTTGIHLHFAIWKAGVGFVDIAGSSLSEWRIGETTHYNGTMTKGELTRTADTSRIKGSNDIVNSVSSDQTGGACFAPGMTSAATGQPVYLNQQQKPTGFFETTGKKIDLFLGKLTRSGNMDGLAMASESLSGCANASCIDQVNHSSSQPLNYSNNRSAGQCEGPPSPAGDSFSGFGGGGAGVAINNNGDGTWDRLRVWSETTTNGEGYSTSHSELRSETEYREVTRSETNTLVSSEAWSTATTVDPTAAATLTFNYNLFNTGSDAAVQLTGVRINILIGDLPVITWNAPDRSSILPGQAKGPFSPESPIHLSLDQLAAIDNGAPIRVVLADYGYDDSLYDQDAWGNGVLFHVDDGLADGDESVDTYLITTQLRQGETYQDTLARYFPIDIFDAGPDDPRTGTLTNIRTPEFDANGEITAWNDHRVGEHGWWELAISLGGETEGIDYFKEMPAKKKHDVYLRYAEDTDGDGYSDRAEIDGLSDANNADIHPRPLLAVAQHTEVSGSTATVQLALQNIGNFDASSVEVWAVAADDSITLTDNLVGGGGRVKAGGHVVLGARTTNLDLSHWTTSTAKPYPGGQYTGLAAKTFTFRAGASGAVGSTAGLTISWTTDGTTWTPLSVGAGYTPLATLPLSDGLTVAFTGDYVAVNETFSFQADLPIDTFSYTINRTPHTPPLIVASYNDPAGNHKFVSDVEVTPIQADLTGYLGEMRYGFQLDIMAETPFAAGANAAYLVFNNPADQAIYEGKLFVEFAKPDGTVVKEYVLADQTFEPGPNVVAFDWNTADFNPAFDPAAEYHILVFAADRQGTIFENTVKRLVQIGHDRLPLAVLPDTTWDFGTAQRGTVLKHTISVANVGYYDLLTFVQGNPGFTLSDSGTRHLPGGDLALYDLTLNTVHLPVGPFQSTAEIRTSDPTHPSRTLTIQGNVTAMPADTPPGTVQRPLDWPAPVSGTQGQWVEFTHNLGPDPQTLHPVKVFSQDYVTLWGVGKCGSAFGQGTVSYEIFGDGRHGDLVVGSGQTVYVNDVRTAVSGTAAAGQRVVPIASAGGFSVGDEVLVIQVQGTGAGNYEHATIVGLGSNTLTLSENLRNSYASSSPSVTVYEHPNYSGRAETFTQDDFCLTDNYVGNDTVSSLSVSPGTTAILYEHCYYGLPAETFTADDPDLGNNPMGHDRTSAIRVSGLGRAQVLRVPNYQNVTVWNGGALASHAWDGNTGGIVDFKVRGTLNLMGSIAANGRGYRGGQGGQWCGSIPCPESGPLNRPGGGYGESYLGPLQLARAEEGINSPSSGGAGGGGLGRFGGGDARGGGGASYQTTGTSGINGGAPAGSTHGTPDLRQQIFLGSGGGGGGKAPNNNYNAPGGDGGVGGGIVIVAAQAFDINSGGSINASGNRGGDVSNTRDESAGGGGGSGGSILITGRSVDVGSDLVRALGGSGGSGSKSHESGGTAGDGRIRIEYCESSSGTTNPPASIQMLTCYIAEQIESSPYDRGRLNMPESFTNGRTYQIQYGRRLTSSSFIDQITELRVPAAAFATAAMDALISGVGSGALTLRVDIGNDSTGLWDWEWTGNVNDAISLTNPDLAAAFNRYWAANGTPTNGMQDVPVKVYLSKAGQVLLTNLQVTPAGSTLRHVRLLAQQYDDVAVGLAAGQTGSGDLTVAADLGDDGTIDWIWTGSATYPQVLKSDNLATAVNAFLQGQTGDVDVPIRLYVSPFLDLSLQDVAATPTAQPDVALTPADITFNPANPTEADQVTVTATLHNFGDRASGPLTASFFAEPPSGGERLIGSAFVPTVPPSSFSPAAIQWNTLGFTGTIPVRVVVDPFNRLEESDEENNQASKEITILTRPDLQVTAVDLSDGEPAAGETVDVSLTLRNSGQTAAPASTLALYDGLPDSGGILVCETTPATPANSTSTATCPWTPATPGLHRLYAVGDYTSAVNESDETNNASWVDVYVGFAGPLLLDSGGASDPAYTPALGYGYLNGQASTFCGDERDQTQRTDAGGQVQYRFDHLLPGHFYHLDFVLFECDSLGRQEKLLVDGNVIGEPVALGDGQPHRVSILLDPAFYVDHSIVVTVKEISGNQAVVSAIDLHDVDYRYADAGAASDLAYSSGRRFGWLDGEIQTLWGTLPYQSRRIDLADGNPADDPDNELRYQFDGLDPDLRYEVHMAFYQGATGVVQQRIAVDGFDTGATVTLNNVQRQDVTVDVPFGAYVADGRIVVRITRTNSTANAFVSEISLEQKTLLSLPAIGDLAVTNVSATAASISWLTDVPASGQVHFGSTPALGQIGHDERGLATISRTHHVTLNGLSPATTYYFYAVSDDRVHGNNGEPLQFTTSPALSPQQPDPIYGQVYLPDGVTPAAGAIVAIHLRDADGQDSPGDSALLSYLILATDDGYWNTNLGNSLTANLQQPFVYSPAGDQVVLKATNGSGCLAEQVIDTADDSPAPPMILTCPTQVTHALTPGWNLLGLNVITDPMPTAEDALDDVEAQGGNTSEINRWLSGGWDAHIHNLPFNNFTLELGKGYFLKSSLASTWQRTGRPPSNPLPLALSPGWNLVSFPRLTCSLAAEQLLDTIEAQGGNCSEVDRWLNGGWNAHIHNLPFNPFAVAIDQGYFLKCSQASSYLPCQGAVEVAEETQPQPAAVAPEQAAQDPIISDVLVTNRRDVALTVTWRTDLASDGWVEYGPTSILGQSAYDDRGQGTVATLHSVTLGNLSPETTYYYRVHSGNTVLGQPFQVTTRPTTPPGAPLTAYGQVQYDGGAPAIGAVLIARLVEGGGEPSEPLSALVDGYGYWVLSLPEVDCASTNVHLRALSPAGEMVELTHPACQCQPAPVLRFASTVTARSVFLPLLVRQR